MGTWTFAYDHLNRLLSRKPSTGAYSGQNLCLAYDSFGNRTQADLQAAACGPSDGPTAKYSAANQVSFTTVNGASNGFAYDAAGDVTYDGANYYAYDAEGRVCAMQTSPISGGTVAWGYLYDAEGRRAAKGSIHVAATPLSAAACDPAANGFAAAETYVLGQGGEQLTALDGGGNWLRTNLFGAGRLLATYDPKGLHFHLADPLGTRRVQTNAAGVPELDCQSLPFGEQAGGCVPDPRSLAALDPGTPAPSDSSPLHFTGQAHDSESGNDFFNARYYQSSLGRFMSPDPAGSWVANAIDPQSWNFYAYARNNPLINIDPSRLDCIYFTDDGLHVQSIDPQDGPDNFGIPLDQQSSDCGAHGGDWVNGTVSNVAADGVGGFNVSSSDGTNAYYTTLTAPDSTDNPNGNCFGDCSTGYSQYSLSNIGSMIVAGSLSDFINWLPCNGVPNCNRPNAQYPLSWPENKVPNNHYCGRNGAGIPQSSNDWACAVHDYNYNQIGVGAGASFNPFLGTWKGIQVQQANQNLCDNVDNSAGGMAIKTAFTVGPVLALSGLGCSL